MDQVVSYYNNVQSIIIEKLPLVKDTGLLLKEYSNPLSKIFSTNFPHPYKEYSIALSIFLVIVCLLNSIILTYLLFVPNQTTTKKQRPTTAKSSNTPTKKQITPKKPLSNKKSNNNHNNQNNNINNIRKNNKALSPFKLPSQESPNKLEYLESIPSLYKTPEKYNLLPVFDDSDSNPSANSDKKKTRVKQKLFETAPPILNKRISVPPVRYSDTVFEGKRK